MKRQLENELTIAMMPYINDSSLPDVKLAIAVVLSKYDIGLNETSLTVYEGDLNSTALARFLAAKTAAGCSVKTLKVYKSGLENILMAMGKPYMDITADDIRIYLAKRLHVDKLQKKTVDNERRYLSTFYGWLQKEEILLKNPMNRIDGIKETKKKKKAFSAMDIEKIRYECKTSRERAIIEVLLSTWCRVSELVEIELNDIQGDRITVHGKGDKYRDVYLNAKAILAVNNYLNDREDNNPYLFPRAKYAGRIDKIAKGKTQKEMAEWYMHKEFVDNDGYIDKGTVESLVRKIGKRAGVQNTHPHRFRRTGATMALVSGMPLIQVSKLLGHESVGTTQIYLDISDDELAAAHKKYVT